MVAPLLTHVFVHVTWYHLLLDGAAFLLLIDGMAECRLSRRTGYVAGSAAGGLTLSWLAAPDLAANGLCGLSGVAHGLMAISALEMIGLSPKHSAQRWYGLVAFGGVAAKAALEAITGGMFFSFLHFGRMGSPIAVSHAGGVVGALILRLWFSRGRSILFSSRQSLYTSFPMLSTEQARAELLQLLQRKSVFHGDFVLSSGAKSNYYVDCRLTTMDPKGAWLAGQVMHSIIRGHQAKSGASIAAVGGLTLGADPVALAIAMFSVQAGDEPPLQMFTVRKAAKGHGQTKLIEGNFRKGDHVVVIDDVITRGDSTLKAIESVHHEGGTVMFVAALVDRQEGGRQRIEELGYSVVAALNRDELLGRGGQ